MTGRLAETPNKEYMAAIVMPCGLVCVGQLGRQPQAVLYGFSTQCFVLWGLGCVAARPLSDSSIVE